MTVAGKIERIVGSSEGTKGVITEPPKIAGDAVLGDNEINQQPDPLARAAEAARQDLELRLTRRW